MGTTITVYLVKGVGVSVWTGKCFTSWPHRVGEKAPIQLVEELDHLDCIDASLIVHMVLHSQMFHCLFITSTFQRPDARAR